MKGPSLFCVVLARLLCHHGSRGGMYTGAENETYPTCHLPESDNSTYVPPADACATDNSAFDLSVAYNIAHLYAPILYHHQLEEYFLADPEDHLFGGSNEDNATIYSYFGKGEDAKFHANLTRQSLFDLARDPETSPKANYYFVNRSKEDLSWRAGAPFNDNGTSTASIYYNVFEYSENIWVFNYYFYFAYNGCSNQWLITSFNDTIGSYMYYLCNLGVHEGDWETVSVMVCKNSDGSAKPLSLKYNQHDFNSQYDCSKDQCALNGTHPLGGIALNSHATYPQLSDNIIYVDVPIPFVYNVRGIHLTDRTQQTESKRFEPHFGNVRRLPNPSEVTSINDENWWVIFGGRWGVTDGVADPVVPPVCMNDNQTSIEPCPIDDPIFDIMLGLFGLKGKEGSPFYFGLGLGFLGAGHGPLGPFTKKFWSNWNALEPAPVYGNITAKSSSFVNESICPRPESWKSTAYLTLSESGTYNKNKFLFILILSFVLSIIFALLLIGILSSSCCLPLQTKYEQTSDDKWYARALELISRMSPLWSLFFFFIVLAGAIMLCVALGHMIDGSLGFYFKEIDWGIIQGAVIAVSCVIIVLSFIFVFSSCAMFILMYYHAMGHSVPDFLKWVVTKNKVNSFFINGGVGVMTVNMFFAVILFLLAFVLGGVYYTVTELCLQVGGVVPDGVCLDFQVFGLKELSCGPEFERFCLSFGRSSSNVVMWGAVLILLGTFYMFLCCISMYWHYCYLHYEYLTLSEANSGDKLNDPSIDNRVL